MSKQYDNNLTGVLFLNDRKETDKHPDRKGSCEIDGKHYWLSGWDKQTSKGDTISLKFEPKDAAKASAPKRQEPERASSRNDFDDETGF